MTPLIFKKTVRLTPPSADDRRAHDQRVRDGLGMGALAIPLSVMRRLPAFASGTGGFPCIIGRVADGLHLIDIGTEASYSVALDLGTTNLVALLYDNITQTDVLMRSVENPQIAYGSDILTRLHHAMSDRAEEVHRSLSDGVNGLIAALCAEAGIERRHVHAVAAAGNTVMSHFFLGLDVST